MGLVDGRTALITGAGHGIGRAIALALAREGANVVLVDISTEGLPAVEAAAAAYGAGALGVQADVSREADVERMVEAAVDRFGRLDILVNNAGVWVIKPFVEQTVEDWDRQHNINLRGVFLTCRRAIPALIAAGGGSIINIASMAAVRFTVPHIPYAASKAGVVALTRDLAVELAPHRIRVNAIAPGPIDSAGHTAALSAAERETAGRRFLLGRIGQPEDIAEAAVFLASDRASYITGALLPVTGGAELRIPPVLG